MSRKRKTYKKLSWKKYWEHKHILDDYKNMFRPHFNQHQDRNEYNAFMNLKYWESLLRYYNASSHEASITTYLHNTFKKSLSEFLACNSPNIRIRNKKTGPKENPQYIEIKYFNDIEETGDLPVDAINLKYMRYPYRHWDILHGLSDNEKRIVFARAIVKSSFKVIAKKLNISEANARKQYQRAKAKIKKNAQHLGYKT